MNRFVLAAAFLAASIAPSAAALLTVDVFDNGVLEGSTTSVSGLASLNITGDPAFDTLSIIAAGEPFIGEGDVSSAALTVTSSAIGGVHNLNIEVFQTGITIPVDIQTNSVFTTNNLIGRGGIGPIVESTFLNGTDSTLGTLLQTTVFPFGLAGGAAGPLKTVLSTPAFADAEQYLLRFDGAGQSSNDTIQLTNTSVPEPATWIMFLLGAAFLGWGAVRRNVSRPTVDSLT